MLLCPIIGTHCSYIFFISKSEYLNKEVQLLVHIEINKKTELNIHTIDVDTYQRINNF